MFTPDYSTPSMGGFQSFVESKDPDECYNWEDHSICACGQYAKSMGMEHWNSATPLWYQFDKIAEAAHVRDNWTFGKLAQRIRSISG